MQSQSQSHESELPPIPPTQPQRQFTFVHAMPDAPSTPYAASCNPARRAKQPRASDALPNTTSTSTSTSTSSTATSPSSVYKKPAPILPATHPSTSTSTSTSSDVQPAKRGRKPGPLSRSARETQRKLNHSIIEKARRTKINDALATLRQLVPVDYGYSKKSKDRDDEDEEDEDGDGDERDVDGDGSGDYEGRRDSGNANANGNGNAKKGKEKKTGGKREEKEKEFKLEILIRTVSFMQDLIARVNVLEDNAGKCTSCGQEKESAKRKRDGADDGAEYRDPEKRQSRRSLSQSAHTDARSHTQPPSTEELTARPTPYNGSRLPSISSWLPSVTNADIDPLLLSPRLSSSSFTQNTHTTTTNASNHQLPSPPSSTTFEPMHPTHLPPVLSLGPIATSALLSLSPRRTPEDESAATLLLQISASPAISSVGGAAPKFDLSRMRTGCITPVGGGGGVGVGYAERERERVGVGVGVQAQTPGSMLGLMNRRG